LEESKRDVKEFLKKTGIEIVGFGAIPEDIETLEIGRGLPRAIVLGYRLSTAVLSTIKDHPTLIYKHHYKTVNSALDQAAYRLALYLQERGHSALPIPASQTMDLEKRRGHISHKRLGLEAGIGFRGRSSLLIHPEFGAAVRYVSVLTDMEFSVDGPIQIGCGDCRKCIPACPAGAIAEEGCDISRCLEKLKEFAGMRGIGQFICGVCVKVCVGKTKDEGRVAGDQ
jgi:epoxyqueuosine reductase QueG